MQVTTKQSTPIRWKLEKGGSTKAILEGHRRTTSISGFIPANLGGLGDVRKCWSRKACSSAVAKREARLQNPH